MTTMTDLLLPSGSTKYKEQVQKLLERQPAVKKDRAGELALRNSFFGPAWTRSCLPGSGAGLGGGRLKKPGWGAGAAGGEMARGWAAQGRGSGGRPGKLQKRNFTSTGILFFLHVLCIFFAFFCFCICFAFPRLGVIFLAWHLFCISPNRESFFLHFFCIS